MRHDAEPEVLNTSLNDETALREYARPYDTYRPGLVPRVLGWFLVACGDLVYGKKPSYLKFRSVEVIARVPYQSWESAVYTLLTLFYSSEERAMELCKLSRFANLAKDNETMHVVVISQFEKRDRKHGVFLRTVIPMIFAFFYYWAAYWLYLISRRAALELNYLFEQHAFAQYSEFVEKNADALKAKSAESAYLAWYGRPCANQYEFFRSVRNDELIHRNRSIEEIER